MKWVWVIAVVLAGLAVGLLWQGGGEEASPLTSDDGDPTQEPDDEALGAILRGHASATRSSAASGTRIEGHILSEGRGVPARVTLHALPSPPAWLPPAQWWGWRRTTRDLSPRPERSAGLAGTDAADDGSFSLAVPALGLYELHAVAADGRSAYRQVQVTIPDAAKVVSIWLADGAPSLHGTVRDAKGGPWRGWVLVRSYGQPARDADRGAALVETDAQGRYAICGLQAGWAFVAVVRPGVMLQRVTRTKLPHVGSLDITVGAGSFIVQGRVIHDDTGAPLAGAIVEALSSQSGDGRAVMTQADGSYALRMPVERFEIRAHKAGFASVLIRTTRWPKSLELRLRPAGSIHGRVVDAATGGGVAGVPVQASMWSGISAADHVWGLSGPSGQFVLDGLQAGDVRVVAWGGGWTPVRATSGADVGVFATCVPGEATSVVAPVERAGTVVGRVLDPDGATVAGAKIAVSEDCLATNHGKFVHDVASDEAGSFRLGDIPPCRDLRLFVTAPDHADKYFGPFVVERGEATSVELVLDPSRWCTVTLVDDAGGTPIPGGSVRARSQRDGGGQGVQRTLRTGADGRVRVGPLPAGPLGFTASAPRYLAWPTRAPGTWQTIKDLAPTGDSQTTIRIQRATPMSGRVTLPDGSPAGGATLSGSPFDAPDWSHWHAKTTADEEGRFTLLGPPTGTYILRAHVARSQGAHYRSQARVEAGASGIEVKLTAYGPSPAPADPAAAATWRIRVLGPDGEPVRTARGVAIWNSKRRSSTSNLQTLGAVFEMPVPDADSTLRLAVTEARAADGSIVGGAHFGPWDATGGEDVVRLAARGPIAGHARDAKGRPLAGVHVTLKAHAPSDWPSKARRGNQRSVRTAPDGAFRFDGVAAATAELHAEAPWGYLEPPPQPVTPGQRDLSLVFQAGIDVVVTVLDPDGKPALGASVDPDPIKPTRGQASGGMADDRGQVKLVGLDPAGTYRLNVGYEQGKQEYWREIEDWTPATLTVKFVHRYNLQGIVRSTSGIPLAEMAISSRDASGDWLNARTDGDGRFTLLDRVGGPIELWVDRNAFSPEEIGDRTPRIMRAESKDIALTFDAGRVVEVLLLRADGRRHLPAAALHVLDHTDKHTRRRDPNRIRGGRTTLRDALLDRKHTLYAGPTVSGRHAHFEGPLPARGPLTLVLKKSAPITGTVLGPTGKPGPVVSVWIQERGVSARVRTSSDGTYSLSGVPPGTWTVRTSVMIKGRAVSRARHAVAGDRVDFDFSR